MIPLSLPCAQERAGFATWDYIVEDVFLGVKNRWQNLTSIIAWPAWILPLIHQSSECESYYFIMVTCSCFQRTSRVYEMQGLSVSCMRGKIYLLMDS